MGRDQEVGHSQSCSTGQLLRAPLAGLCPDTQLCLSSLRVSPPSSCRPVRSVLKSHWSWAQAALWRVGTEGSLPLSVSKTGGSQFLNCRRAPLTPVRAVVQMLGRETDKCPVKLGKSPGLSLPALVVRVCTPVPRGIC